MSENIEGWPDSDPYPFRGLGDWPPVQKEETDCDFVARDKDYAKTAIVEEIGDYAYIMKYPWQLINEQARKIKDLEEHIQWLKNVGGERLNMACGWDIFCRDMVIKQRNVTAKKPVKEAKVLAETK